MARVALTGLSRSLAHAGRLARLGCALAARGHEVFALGAPGWFGEPSLLPAGCGVTVVPLAEPPLEESLRSARGQPSAMPDHQRFLEALAGDRAALDALRPEVLVVDNRRSALVAAELAGLPSVSLTTAALLGPRGGLRLRGETLRRVFGPLLGLPAEGAGAPERRFGLQPVPLPGPLALAIIAVGARPRATLHELSLGTHTLSLDPPALLTVDEGVLQPGPIFPRLHLPRPSFLDALDERPVVYLSYGSTGEPRALQEVARALSDLDVQLIISSADLAAAAELPDAHVARLLPADPVLQRADLVVCHGGTLTVYHALAHGCPALMMPSHLEQAATAALVHEAGLGVALAQRDVRADPAVLTGAVARLLDDTAMRRRAAGLASKIDGDAALAAAVDCVERAAAG